jgi:peroxiredoxin
MVLGLLRRAVAGATGYGVFAAWCFALLLAPGIPFEANRGNSASVPVPAITKFNSPRFLMNGFLVITYLVLWLIVLILGFLLVGALRSLALVQWRMKQLEATSPSHIRRRGLKIGVKAPEFTLPSLQGGTVTLSQCVDRDLLLVFIKPSCAACSAIVPALNRLNKEGCYRVLAVSADYFPVVEEWSKKERTEFPILIQEGLTICLQYNVAWMPFAFLISEQMRVKSKGL